MSTAQTAAPAQAYRSHAGRYDQRTRTFQHWREQLVEHLPVGPGDTVLDIGCGTGLCMPGLQHKIGPTGTIVGIDASPDMLELAAQRVAENDWLNVHLINAPVDKAEIGSMATPPCSAPYTTSCNPPPRSRTCSRASGPARRSRRSAANGQHRGYGHSAWVADLHAPFITDFTGFDQPWTHLTHHVPDLTIKQLGTGTGYLAHGHTPTKK